MQKRGREERSGHLVPCNARKPPRLIIRPTSVVFYNYNQYRLPLGSGNGYLLDFRQQTNILASSHLFYCSMCDSLLFIRALVSGKLTQPIQLFSSPLLSQQSLKIWVQKYVWLSFLLMFLHIFELLFHLVFNFLVIYVLSLTQVQGF